MYIRMYKINNKSSYIINLNMHKFHAYMYTFTESSRSNACVSVIDRVIIWE